MAKRLLFIAAGALALTACTSEDVVKDATKSRNLIQFENVVNKHLRGQDITSDELVHFNVFGFYTLPGKDDLAHQVFYNIPVDRTDNTQPWTYTVGGERYWVPGAKYYFYAYSCNNSVIDKDKYADINYTLDMSDGKPASERVLKILNYTCDDTHQHDLIFASNTGENYGGILGQETGKNTEVALQFSHILSKVKTRFTTKFPTEYDIVIRDMSFQNVPNKGDFDPVNKWTGVTRSGANPCVTLLAGDNSIMINNEVVNDKQKSVDSPHGYVIPRGSDDTANAILKDVKLTFTIDVYLNTDTKRENKILSKTLTAIFTPVWNPAYTYIYNIDLNGKTTNMEVIAFTTTVDEFGEEIQDINGSEEDPFTFTVTDNDVTK